MKIIDKIKENYGEIISIELVPPNWGKGMNEFKQLLEMFIAEGVSYFDITYHPEDILRYDMIGGAIHPIQKRKKPGTLGLAGFVKGKYNSNIEIVPHVICTGFDKQSTEELLIELNYLDIGNVLALRGDSPKGPDGKKIPYPHIVGGNQHANELIEQISALKKGKYVDDSEGTPIDFCIGAACYPELHEDSRKQDNPSEHELYWTKKKVEAGSDFLVTQMFFDNNAYKVFVEKARENGINVPVIPGIMPLRRYEQLSKLSEIFGCNIPSGLSSEVEKYKDHENSESIIRDIGIEWCVEQCKDLKKYGAPSLHFYALNNTPKNAPVKEVIKKLMAY